ncbi:MAG: NAD(P)H-hydrate dehydratase [Bacteroidia bacterium]
MKILSAKQQQLADAFTIKNQPIASVDLMELASKRWIEHCARFIKSEKIIVVAGIGNNGGDGLAIARLLQQRGFNISVLLCHFGKTLSADCLANLKRLSANIPLTHIDTEQKANKIAFGEDDTVIDALFGSGLNRKIAHPFSIIVDKVNNSSCNVLAVDIPSGLFADKANNTQDPIIKANHTVTFQSPKLAFLFNDCYKYVNEFTTANIDLDKSYINSLESPYFYTTENEITNTLKPRTKFDHKGSFGHLGVYAGATETIGAAYLSALAGFGIGAGLVSLIVQSHKNITTHWPHLMHQLHESINADKFTICIGPGFGTNQKSKNILIQALSAINKPMVIDADALNILAKSPNLLSLVPKNSVLTPHPKELQRLIGKSPNSFNQLKKAQEFAIKHGVILLIKRAHTAVINSNGQVYFNSTGNAGLAKAGSGDLLSGIIAALICQGYTSLNAAKIGVYTHGKAADDLLLNTSNYSFTPNQLIAQMGLTLKNLGV